MVAETAAGVAHQAAAAAQADADVADRRCRDELDRLHGLLRAANVAQGVVEAALRAGLMPAWKRRTCCAAPTPPSYGGWKSLRVLAHRYRAYPGLGIGLT